MGQRSLRPGIVAGVMISLTVAAAASQASGTPALAFVQVAVAGLLCTLLAVALLGSMEPSGRGQMTDPRGLGEHGSDRRTGSPHDQVLRLRLGLGIIVFAFGVVAVILLVTTGEATRSSMLVAVIDIVLGPIYAISGWRELRRVTGSRDGQPPG